MLYFRSSSLSLSTMDHFHWLLSHHGLLNWTWTLCPQTFVLRWNLIPSHEVKLFWKHPNYHKLLSPIHLLAFCLIFLECFPHFSFWKVYFWLVVSNCKKRRKLQLRNQSKPFLNELNRSLAIWKRSSFGRLWWWRQRWRWWFCGGCQMEWLLYRFCFPTDRRTIKQVIVE